MEPWRCLDCKAVLGQVQVNGNGKEELLLYREAVQLSEDAPAGVDVVGMVRHSVIGWRCSSCGKPRSWYRQNGHVTRDAQTYRAE